MTKQVLGSDLHVEYFGGFYTSEEANDIFTELQSCPFQDICLKIGGKNYTPKRKVCAYGDQGICYAFSGTSVEALNWTPLLLKIKTDVEAVTKCKYNFVLLNSYADGTSKINAHKDNESCLQPDTAIAAVSFGATRTLRFTRPKHPAQELSLEHGSLVIMHAPTNKYWSHAIPASPETKEPRISLTFRNIVNVSNDNSEVVTSPGDVAPGETTPTAPATRQKRCADEMELPEKDWLTEYIASDSAIKITKKVKNYELISAWPLGSQYFVSIIYDQKNLRIHIREVKERAYGNIPTNNGVVMTPTTWTEFAEKIGNFAPMYKDTSFIVNNELLVANVEGDPVFQQMFKAAPYCFTFKPSSINLLGDQFDRLKNHAPAVSQELLETLYARVLPDNFIAFKKTWTYPEHSACTAKDFFQLLIEQLEKLVYEQMKHLFKCMACILCDGSQANHLCITTTDLEKFNYVGRAAMTRVSFPELINIVSRKHCMCNVTESYFKNIGLESYVNNLEKYLTRIY